MSFEYTYKGENGQSTTVNVSDRVLAILVKSRIEAANVGGLAMVKLGKRKNLQEFFDRFGTRSRAAGLPAWFKDNLARVGMSEALDYIGEIAQFVNANDATGLEVLKDVGATVAEREAFVRQWLKEQGWLF